MAKNSNLKVVKRAQRKVAHSVRDASRQVMQYVDHYQAAKVNPADTLIITGFWRSGTTWLMTLVSQLLDTKTMFEPLHVKVFSSQNKHPYAPIIDPAFPYGDDYLQYFMPFAEEDFSAYADLGDFLEKSLRAEISNRWAQVGRVRHSDAFRTRVTCKMVRGQLCILAMNRVFGAPILHVYRDPRAVIASIIRNDWGHWIYDISLRNVLLEIPDGRAEYFEQFTDIIDAYDHEDIVARLAVYWAVTEKYVAHLAQTTNVPTILSYDTLMSGGHDRLKQTLRDLGVATEFNEQIEDAPSEMTQHTRVGIAKKKVKSGWRSELEPDVIGKIETIVTRLDMHHLLPEK